MEQIARNLTDREDGFLTAKRFFIIDQDSIFSPAFKSIVASADVEILLTAYQAPNMNAHAERFIRSVNSECLRQMTFLGQRPLDRTIKEYVDTITTSAAVRASGIGLSAARSHSPRAVLKSGNDSAEC